MMRRRKKNGQGSLEFVSIASFMFIIFIATFVTIEGRMSGVYRDKLYKSMGELSRLITSEIRMADFAPGDYTREFYLPYAVGNFNYSINISGRTELTINAEGLDFVVFLDQNVSGDLGKGENLITKTDDVINIAHVCIGGHGTDDDDCGIIDCSGYYYHETYSKDCYNKTDITYDRCASIGQCKAPNSGNCSYRPNNVQPVYTCNECQIIVGCTINDRGSCYNQVGIPCHGGGICDGNGHCSTD
jgi:hypothetical protein